MPGLTMRCSGACTVSGVLGSTSSGAPEAPAPSLICTPSRTPEGLALGDPLVLPEAEVPLAALLAPSVPEPGESEPQADSRRTTGSTPPARM